MSHLIRLRQESRPTAISCAAAAAAILELLQIVRVYKYTFCIFISTCRPSFRVSPLVSLVACSLQLLISEAADNVSKAANEGDGRVTCQLSGRTW